MITGYGINSRPLCIECAHRFGIISDRGSDAETDLLEVIEHEDGDLSTEVACSVPTCDSKFIVGYTPETEGGGGGRIRATVIDRGY